ncbi:hypothetical protein LTR12_007641 [Friedmanniomyces endolithicus]|nr:hypothetical protein LTR12_007641 [Friedmanniomyces endolithicus]
MLTQNIDQSWPTILSSGVESPWIVRTCWYCGIVFSLFAVLTAAQQSIRLHRMATHRDAWRNIRLFMGAKYRDEEGIVRCVDDGAGDVSAGMDRDDERTAADGALV